MSFRPRVRQQQEAQRPGFFSLVAIASLALYAKEQWEEYKARKATQGGISLGDGNGLPAYQELPTSDDADSRSLRDGLGAPILNADGTHARSGRTSRRKKSCCMCCGIPIDIVCKALGIVTLGYLLYGIYSFLTWANKPDPSPDAFRPDFNSSIALGCPSAPFQTIYSIAPIAASSLANREAAFHIERQSSLSGTITLTKSTDPAQWQFQLVGRASSAAGLEALINAAPTTSKGVVAWQPPASFVGASDTECLRYDLTIGLPSDASAGLVVDVLPVTHVRFDASLSDVSAPHALASLSVNLRSLSGPWSAAPRLPRSTDEHVDVRALQRGMSSLTLSPAVLPKRASYKVQSRGFLDGSASILSTLALETTGDALAHATLLSHPYPGRDSAESTAHALTTASGTGLATTYKIDASASGSPFSAQHTADEDLYLTYRAPAFAGPVRLGRRGTGHSFRNVQSIRGESFGSDTYYVGDLHGEDKLTVNANKWLSLRF